MIHGYPFKNVPQQRISAILEIMLVEIVERKCCHSRLSPFKESIVSKRSFIFSFLKSFDSIRKVSEYNRFCHHLITVKFYYNRYLLVYLNAPCVIPARIGSDATQYFQNFELPKMKTNMSFSVCQRKCSLFIIFSIRSNSNGAYCAGAKASKTDSPPVNIPILFCL